MTGVDPARPHLVVIDAQIEVRRALEQLLEPVCPVRSFESQAAAIEAIGEATAAVLVDVGPRGGDGARVFEAIVTKNRHLPVIFLSAYQDPRETSEPISRYRPFARFARGSDPRLLLDIVHRAVRYSQAITDIKRLVLKVHGVQESLSKLKTREP